MQGGLYVCLQAAFADRKTAYIFDSAGRPPQLQLTALLLSIGPEGKISVRETSHCTCTEKGDHTLIWLPSKPRGAARTWRSVSSLALLTSVRNVVIPLPWSRNYFFINKMRYYHFCGLPDCHWKQVSLKCISEKVVPVHRGRRTDFLEQWRSYVLHLFIIFMWGKQLCYHTHLLRRIILFCPILAKNTIQAHAPSAYLLYN